VGPTLQSVIDEAPLISTGWDAGLTEFRYELFASVSLDPARDDIIK
jgi:hypothetical protein